MTVVENSLICRFLLSLWEAILGTWEHSRVCQALRGFGRGVANTVQHSAVCQTLWREGTLPRIWPDSLVCRLLTFLFNLPGTVCKLIYRVGKNVWDGSLFARTLGWVCGQPYFFLGGFVALMLMVPHGSWNNLYGLFGAVAVTGIFYLGAASRPGRELEIKELGPYYIFFMAFVAYAFLGSLDWKLSFRFVGFHLAAFLLCLLAVSAVRKYEHLELVVALAVAGLTIAALYGCYQGAVGVSVVANQQDLLLNKGMPGRVYSFFDNPNNFAELLVMLTPFTYALFLNAKTWRGKLAALFSLGVCGVALGLTFSRSGWLGFVLATVVFVAFWNWKAIPLLVVLGACAIPFLPESIYNRILTIGNTEDSSTSYRFAIYKASAVLMKDYWLRGVGLGSDILTRTFKGYPPMFDGNFPIHTHNNYLQVWAEMGLGAIVAFLTAIVYQLKRALRCFVGCTDKRLRNLLAAAVAGFCGILLISVAEYTWFYARNMFTYFFLFGVITACGKLCKGQAEEKA